MRKLFTVMLVSLLLVGCSTPKQEENTGITGKINIYTRDGSSGTREAFEKGVGVKELSQNVIEAASNGDMATKVGNDTNGIGYVSLTTDFEANNVVPLQFEGVVANEENALNGTYKLQRPFDFVTRVSGDYESDAKEQLILAFLDYLQNSKEGMLVVENAGGIVDITKAVPWAELAKNHPIVSEDNSAISINTVGSTSVEKTIKAALESFVPLAGNFQFTMNQSGSGDAYKRVLGAEKDGANKGDIGFASRNFNADEDVSVAALTGTYCIDAVVAIVNKANTTLTTLTAVQLKDIFEGTIANFEDIK